MCEQKIKAANSCSEVQDYVTKGNVLGQLARFWDEQQSVLSRCGGSFEQLNKVSGNGNGIWAVF